MQLIKEWGTEEKNVYNISAMANDSLSPNSSTYFVCIVQSRGLFLYQNS